MQRLGVGQLLSISSLRLSAALRTTPLETANVLSRSLIFKSVSDSRRFNSTEVEPHPVTELIEKTLPPSKEAEKRWLESSKRALEDARNHPPANPYSGRTVTNTSGKNLAGTFKRLESILVRNEVRKELRLTERHEKKGVKRRRLSSQRWRQRFADEVRKKVQLVIKIKERGA